MTTVKVILKCETQSVMANLKSDSQFMRNIATLGGEGEREREREGERERWRERERGGEREGGREREREREREMERELSLIHI